MSNTELRKLPPQSLEAEMSILGGILIDNDAINRVLEVLTDEDFYRESHRKIFLAMMKLSELREPRAREPRDARREPHRERGQRREEPLR